MCGGGMRVITGSARGRKLLTLPGDDVRPTTDKVKESVFNIIQFAVPACSFLDLFAGSGQIGIEALSRGAAKATFVDSSKSSIEVVRKNLSSTGFENESSVFQLDSIAFLARCGEKFDLAFLDPPYGSGLLQAALRKIGPLMNENGIVVCENPVDEELDDSFENLEKEKEYRYGKLKLTKYIVP